jgi:PIN domain nuclease of toxin-antitoxin system
MRLLLDTHVVLWELRGARTVGARAQAAIEEAAEMIFSVVSFAEVGVKAAAGKLVVPDDLQEHVVRSGLRILALAPAHGLEVANLPMHHRDPFDRLLISQARSEGLTLLTADQRIGRYDVSLIDASA